jgi:hypothetical protein
MSWRDRLEVEGYRNGSQSNCSVYKPVYTAYATFRQIIMLTSSGYWLSLFWSYRFMSFMSALVFRMQVQYAKICSCCQSHCHYKVQYAEICSCCQSHCHYKVQYAEICSFCQSHCHYKVQYAKICSCCQSHCHYKVQYAEICSCCQSHCDYKVQYAEICSCCQSHCHYKVQYAEICSFCQSHCHSPKGTILNPIYWQRLNWKQNTGNFLNVVSWISYQRRVYETVILNHRPTSPKHSQASV